MYKLVVIMIFFGLYEFKKKSSNKKKELSVADIFVVRSGQNVIRPNSIQDYFYFGNRLRSGIL